MWEKARLDYLSTRMYLQSLTTLPHQNMKNLRDREYVINNLAYNFTFRGPNSQDQIRVIHSFLEDKNFLKPKKEIEHLFHTLYKVENTHRDLSVNFRYV